MTKSDILRRPIMVVRSCFVNYKAEYTEYAEHAERTPENGGHA